jgi:hypothetical protein
MLDFISLLRQRYQTVYLHLNPQSAMAEVFTQRIEQLTLTEAVIRKNRLFKSMPSLPLQIAVIGPTQVGKSSITNLIVNYDVAEVSPLAGYTVQPQGFCTGIDLSICSDLKNYFIDDDFQNQTQASGQRSPMLSQNPKTAPLLPPCVIWDTPDFDSMTAGDYRHALIQTIALADLIVLVLSPEKYADQTVWELMATLEPLRQPTLICLNKLVAETALLIQQSLKEKWQRVRSDSFAPLVAVYYQAQGQRPIWPKTETQIFFQLAKTVNHSLQLRYQQALISQHWSAWLEPVLMEHQATELWRQRLNYAVEQAVNDYQRDYLNHPYHYQTFQQAIVELLYLLEIPGLARLLTPLHRALAWPLRQLTQWRKKSQPHRYPTQELALLNQIGEHLLTQLAEQLLATVSTEVQLQAWWRELYQLIRQQHHVLLADFNRAATDYQLGFQPAIEATARQLYQKLQQQPALLNSLRATRLTADAAVLALGLQAGGIGLHDMLIAPALLAVVSLLTESAIGGYMNILETQLKQQQLSKVKNDLMIKCLQNALTELPQQMSNYHRFAISPEQLQFTQQALEKRHGLRLR